MTYTNNPTGPEAIYTSPPHPIAEIYGRWVLDFVVELAYAVSLDFAERPHHYRQIPEKVADLLSGFSVSIESKSHLPDLTQRVRIYNALLGSSFCAASTALRRAAINYVDHSSEKGEEFHHQAFQDAALALRACLKAFDGAAVSAGDRLTGTIFKNATEVLKSQEVAHRFGLSDLEGGWLQSGVSSGDGAFLCEEIAKTLRPRVHGPASQYKFIALQRAANHGMHTIAGVLDESLDWNDTDRINALIRSAYGWTRALQDIVSDIIRAWKDSEYRQSLSDMERALLPDHPAGEIDLKDTELDPAALRRPLSPAETFTIFGEICCCNSVDYCDTLRSVICLCVAV